MKKRTAATCAATMFLTGALLTGCMAPSQANSSSSNDPAAINRTYMSEVRATFSQVESEMGSFVAAVQADNAGMSKDSLAKIDALVSDLQKVDVPSGLESVQQGYVEGSRQMASALHDYAAYRQGDRSLALTAIQMEYDTGLAILKKTDEMAANM